MKHEKITMFQQSREGRLRQDMEEELLLESALYPWLDDPSGEEVSEWQNDYEPEF